MKSDNLKYMQLKEDAYTMAYKAMHLETAKELCVAPKDRLRHIQGALLIAFMQSTTIIMLSYYMYSCTGEAFV